MAVLWVKYDTTEKKFIATSAAPGGFTDEHFDTGAGDVTEVQLVATIQVGTKIDVGINGKDLREGVTHDWTRDVGNKKILFNFIVPQNAWVKVRIHS